MKKMKRKWDSDNVEGEAIFQGAGREAQSGHKNPQKIIRAAKAPRR